MDSVKQIMDEHRVIERAIDVLEKIAQGLEEFREIPPELIMADLGVTLECTEAYHFAKEEGILIPYLEEIGKLTQKDKIVFNIKHVRANQKFIDAIYEALDTYEPGNLESAMPIIENGFKYVEQVRPIYQQEDEDVIKSLKNDLNETEIAELNKKYKDFEYDWEGPNVVNYQKIVRDLELKSSMMVW